MLQNKQETGNNKGPDSDDMSSFFPCEIDDAIHLGYGAQAPKIVIL